MGWVVRRRKGRIRAARRTCEKVLFCRSSSVWNASLPLSWRIFLARRRRILGAYVSRRKNSPITCTAASAIDVE